MITIINVIMSYHQVIDVNQKFAALERQKQGHWRTEGEDEVSKISASKSAPTHPTATCGSARYVG